RRGDLLAPAPMPRAGRLSAPPLPQAAPPPSARSAAAAPAPTRATARTPAPLSRTPRGGVRLGTGPALRGDALRKPRAERRPHRTTARPPQPPPLRPG